MLTYKKSGVNVNKADSFVKAIRPLVKSTKIKGALGGIGGFGGFFELALKKYKNPVLVSSTDGVGTKLKVAQLVNKHDTLGIDLVAMNVNDILCSGARPLFFLDYIACGKLNKNVLVDLVKGMVQGCKQSGCSLIGGETAEMPGMYEKDEYDLAGFCVGIVEKNKIINGSDIKAGDKIIGLASNGLHANGFSLVRRVFSKDELKKYSSELLKPTKIYVKPVLSLLNLTKGIAHITGGAFYDKISRIIPPDLDFIIDKNFWIVPKIFKMIQEKGNIPEKDMYHTFNMGIGMVLAVKAKHAEVVIKKLEKFNLKSLVIGQVAKGRGEIKLI